MADTLDTTFVQPFQGPQGAENALKLASVLAPRINLGSRPLQPGEGEGLRNLFGAFGTFAEQKRRKNSEGQALSGLQAVMAGNAPISTLPVSDLPEATQRILFEQVAKQATRNAPLTMTERAGLMAPASTIAERGGDPMAALKALGISVGGEAPASPPAVSAPTTAPNGPVTMSPALAIAPSVMSRPAPTPGPESSPFGRQNAALDAYDAHQRLAKLVSESPGLLTREAVLAAGAGLPHETLNSWITQLDRAGRLQDTTGDYLQRVQQYQRDYPDLFPAGIKTTLESSGPKIEFAMPTPHTLGPGQTAPMIGPQGNEIGRLAGPPPTQEQNIRFLPDNLQQPAREAMTGLRPKAGEAGRLVESALNREARENKPQKAPAERAPSQFRAMVNSYKDEFGTLEATPDTSNEWFGKASQSPRQQAEASAKVMEKNDPTEARAMRQAIRELFGPEVKAPNAPTGTPAKQSAPTDQQTRPMAKSATDFFKKYGGQ
jgi:hypothetical protein